MTPNPARLKRAELTSGVGAGVLGAGVGVLLAAQLRPLLLPTLLIGALLHGWGMWDKHRMEREHRSMTPRWAVLLYWICWGALAALGVYVVVLARTSRG